jgi:cytochrome c6
MKKTLLIASCLLALPFAVRAGDVPANWAKNCAACHGVDGKGGTKAGRMAGVKDMSDAAYQKTFTDDQAIAQIKNGFKNDQGKMKMKAFGGKFNDREIKDLVAYIRSLDK